MEFIHNKQKHYLEENGFINTYSFNEIVEYLKEKILNQHHITIDKILVEPEQHYIGRENMTCSFNIPFTFIGTNEKNIKSIYTCNCNVNFELTEEEFEKARADGIVHFIKGISRKCCFRKCINVESIKDEDVNIDQLNCKPIKDLIYHKYTKNISCHSNELIYQPDDEMTEQWLYYVRLSNSHIEKNMELNEIIEANDFLYIHPSIDYPEFDSGKTLYEPIHVTKEGMRKIKNKIKDLNDNGNGCFTYYCNYKEVYRSETLLIYQVGMVYYMVTDPKLIRTSEYLINNILHINNCWELGISGEVKNITPVMYGYCFNGRDMNYQVDDKKKFIRSIGCEGDDLDYDDKADDYIHPAKDLLAVNMKDGSQGYIFLNIPLEEQEEKSNDKPYVKRAIYLAPKNNNKRKK